LLEQRLASPEMLSQMVGEFLDNPSVCARARAALEGWHKPRAATEIVELVLQTVAKRRQGAGTAMPATPASASTRHSSVLA